MPLRRSMASRRSIGARSAVNVGWPIWSSTNDSVGCWSSNRSTVRTMLPPCCPHTHDVRTTGRVDAGVHGLALAGELAGAVHAGRVRHVPLVVRPIERAVEHVVGADRDEVGVAHEPMLRRPTARPVHWR